MAIEVQAGDLAQDGSISLTIDGKHIKFVKESDLGAVKSALKDKEVEVSKLQADLAGTTSKYDAAHQDVLKERAAKEQFEKDAKEGTTLKTKLTELETKLADATKLSGESQTKLTERLKSQLISTYKIEEAKLADKALPDLENIENALKLTGKIPIAANYDGGNGASGVGGLDGKSPLALAEMGYAQK